MTDFLQPDEIRALQTQLEASNQYPPMTPNDFDLSRPHSTPHKKPAAGTNKTATVAVACEFCQRRKIRCGGGSPCERCASRGIECIYATPAKRGPKPKKARGAQQNASQTRQAEPPQQAQQYQLRTNQVLSPENQLELQRSSPSFSSSSSPLLSPVTNQSFEELLAKYNALRMELDIESRLSQHWRQQYFRAQTAVSVIQSAQQKVPEYGDKTKELLHDAINTVEKLLEVFLTGNQWRHPSYRWSYPMMKSVEIFKQLTSVHADTARAMMRQFDLPTLAAYFEHTAMFLAATSMLTIWDLADQFQQISLDLLQMLFFEREAQTDASVAQQLLYCLVILSDYFKYNGRKGTQQSIRLIAAQILERFEKTLDDSEFVIGIYISCLTGSTSEPARQYWISKITNCINTNGIRLRNSFLYTFADVFSALKTSWGSTSMLTHFMAKLEQAEYELNQFVQLIGNNKSTLFLDHVAFYQSWIHVLKAEIYHRQNKKDESLAWVQRTCLSFNVIQSDCLRAQLRGLVKFCVTLETEVPAPLNVFHILANWLGITNALESGKATAVNGSSVVVYEPSTPTHQPSNFYVDVLSREGQLHGNVPTVSIDDLSDSAGSSATSPLPLSGDEMMDTGIAGDDSLMSLFGGGADSFLGVSSEIAQFAVETPTFSQAEGSFLAQQMNEYKFDQRKSPGRIMMDDTVRVTCL